MTDRDSKQAPWLTNKREAMSSGLEQRNETGHNRWRDGRLERRFELFGFGKTRFALEHMTSVAVTAAAQLADSHSECQRLARCSGSSFYFSFFLLPRPQFAAMCALYAFMRITDDLADAPGRSVEDRRNDLASWQDSLHAALSGKASSSPVLPAIADTVQRFRIPESYLDDVITGVRMDLETVCLQTDADLEKYCYHVAGAVGLACIHVWGFSSPDAVPLAIDCGYAFQLTNILRDVAEDAAAGRVYLPAEHLQRFGVTASDFTAGRLTASVRELLAFEAGRAREAFDRSQGLQRHLSPHGRRILAAMWETYRELLAEIVRREYDVFHGRIRLSRLRRAWIVAKNWWR